MKSKKYRLQKDLMFLSISMFVTICLWIGFNIYDTYATTTIGETLQTQIIPIEGKFDMKTLQQLKERVVIQADYSDTYSTDSASPTNPVIQSDPAQTGTVITPEISSQPGQ